MISHSEQVGMAALQVFLYTSDTWIINSLEMAYKSIKKTKGLGKSNGILNIKIHATKHVTATNVLKL